MKKIILSNKFTGDKTIFENIILEKARPFLKLNSSEIELFSKVNYDVELNLKNLSLQEFWKSNKLKGIPEKIEPSPKPRNYRTTSKRRVVFKAGKYYLLSNINEKFSELVQKSNLEAEEHFKIFKYLSDIINKTAYNVLGNKLNYIIIRGNYIEYSVIFNVKIFNALIIRKLKDISELLKKTEIKIISAFAYLDPSESKYYFESRTPTDKLQFKKLFGKDNLSVQYENKRFFYHPISFSQVNESMMNLMLPKIRQLLVDENVKDTDYRLIDLYCGYGLFSFYLSEDFKEIIGVDYESESIKSARESLNYYKGKTRIKFISENINLKTLSNILPPANKNEIFILDPPKAGIDEKVIDIISARNPDKILHIFCGIDEIPDEVRQWEKNGYEIKKIIPLDMFPGTPNLEIMILFTKK